MIEEVLDVRHVSAETFQPFVGERFEVSDEEAGTPLAEFVLRKVAPAPEPGARPFSLFFEGPAQPELPQMILYLSHPKCDPMGLFLVPIAADAKHREYQAVFN